MLILLDIDGVMIPANSWRKPEFHEDGFPVFTPQSVAALNRIILETDAQLVLSTSHKMRYSMGQWAQVFKKRGVVGAPIGRLNNNKVILDRKTEILNWSAQPQNIGEHYVILDDDKMLNDLPLSIKENLILTIPSIGLTNELAECAIAKLNRHESLYAF